MNDIKPSASIIIPAYKEAANLRALLPNLDKICRATFPSYEIIVVDAAEPSDDTAAAVAQTPGVKYLNRCGGYEYGHAVRSGIKAAGKERIFFMDADGSHEPADIAQMYAYVNDYDLVIGSRYTKGGGSDNSKILTFQSSLLNAVFRAILGLEVKDISNSLRMYRADMLKNISLECLHFDILEEILIKLQIAYPKMTFKEVPIHFKKRRTGASNREFFVFIISFMKTALKLWRMKRRAAKDVK